MMASRSIVSFLSIIMKFLLWLSLFSIFNMSCVTIEGSMQAYRIFTVKIRISPIVCRTWEFPDLWKAFISFWVYTAKTLLPVTGSHPGALVSDQYLFFALNSARLTLDILDRLDLKKCLVRYTEDFQQDFDLLQPWFSPLVISVKASANNCEYIYTAETLSYCWRNAVTQNSLQGLWILWNSNLLGSS